MSIFPPRPNLQFIFNKFYFNDSFKTIYWEEPEDCHPPVEYELNDWMIDSTNTIRLNTTEYSISTRNLSKGHHYIYIVAVSGGILCSTTPNALYIPSIGMLSLG